MDPVTRRLSSKQLTLCYCDSAEEAAVARDMATLWNWHHLGGQEHGGQQRLNFALTRWVGWRVGGWGGVGPGGVEVVTSAFNAGCGCDG